MKTLNINASVRIKLTPFGLNILKNYHDDNFPPTLEFTPPDVDEEGYCEMQLYEVMHVFGQYMNIASPNYPFDLLIQIEDSKFES